MLHCYKVTMLQHIQNMGEQSPYILRKGHIHRVEDNPPLWFREQFEEALTDFPSNRYKKKKAHSGSHRGAVSVRLCLHTPQTPIVVTPAEMVEILKDNGLGL